MPRKCRAQCWTPLGRSLDGHDPRSALPRPSGPHSGQRHPSRTHRSSPSSPCPPGALIGIFGQSPPLHPCPHSGHREPPSGSSRQWDIPAMLSAARWGRPRHHQCPLAGPGRQELCPVPGSTALAMGTLPRVWILGRSGRPRAVSGTSISLHLDSLTGHTYSQQPPGGSQAEHRQVGRQVCTVGQGGVPACLPSWWGDTLQSVTRACHGEGEEAAWVPVPGSAPLSHPVSCKPRGQRG